MNTTAWIVKKPRAPQSTGRQTWHERNGRQRMTPADSAATSRHIWLCGGGFGGELGVRERAPRALRRGAEVRAKRLLPCRLASGGHACGIPA